MPLFGRKKEEIEKEIKDIEEIKKTIEPIEALPKIEEKIPEPERPAFAPLFVKLDRYKIILDSLTELRTMITAIKNAFASLIELETLKRENLKIIQNAIGKVERRLAALDSEFLRPAGYEEEVAPEVYTSELEPSIADLKSQVEKLKSELKSIT
jgi:hypothetical protein